MVVSSGLTVFLIPHRRETRKSAEQFFRISKNLTRTNFIDFNANISTIETASELFTIGVICLKSLPPKVKHTVCFTDLRKAKFACGGPILSSNQFLLLPQLPQKSSSLQKWSKLTQKYSSRYLKSKSVKLTVVCSKLRCFSWFSFNTRWTKKIK